MSGSSDELDTVLDLCGNDQRRIVIAALVDRRRTVTVDELTEVVAKHGHGTSPTAASDEVLKRIKTSLHHVHVPKLDAAGIVEYDVDRQLVEPTDRLNRIEPQLSALLDADSRLASRLEQ